MYLKVEHMAISTTYKLLLIAIARKLKDEEHVVVREAGVFIIVGKSTNAYSHQ